MSTTAPVMGCNTLCACETKLPPGLSALYRLSFRGATREVNFSTAESQCTLGHEIPANTSWQDRTSRDIVKVLLSTYMAPPVIVITIVTNLLICVVLTRKHMVSPTNIILLSMALADMLTGIFPLPWYLLSEFAHEWTVNRICDSPTAVNLLSLMTTTLPTIFHTVSIWLTVILAIQRWIYITFPMSVQRLCTNRISAASVLILLALVTIFMCAWFYLDGPYQVASPVLDVNGPQLLVSCNLLSEQPIFMVIIYARILLVNLVPSVLLIVFTSLLINGLREAARRRRSLLSPKARQQQQQQQQDQHHRRRDQEQNNTTAMLTLVVGIFMVVELPMTVVMSLFALNLASREFMGFAVPIINFTILVTYPVNFFIYSMMSSQFRHTFSSIFHCCPWLGQQAQQQQQQQQQHRQQKGTEPETQPLCQPQAVELKESIDKEALACIEVVRNSNGDV